MKNDVLIYPYDSSFAPILRSNNFIDKFNEIHLCSLNGSGLCGKDASIADGGSALNLVVKKDFDALLSIVDTVIFTEVDSYIDFEWSLYPKIKMAIDAHKKIINLAPLSPQIREELRINSIENEVLFEDYSNNPDSTIDEINCREGILNINTPVIVVMGLSNSTGKFTTQINIKKQLEESGYKISMIGSRSYCEFLGYHSFPNFMTERKFDDVEKIFLFNKYIKNIEKSENPDVIVICIPGGIVPYDNKIHNNFGITAFLVSQAVVPDASVLCLFHEDFTAKYLELIGNTVKYRFGFEIDAYNISNRQIDWVEMVNAKPEKVRSSTINIKLIDKTIEKVNSLTTVPIYNLLSDKGDLTEMLINKLSENSNSVVF
ncbi:hypothetical protein GCM10010912_44410 [Paenibacillus albidus]|uniref:TIGR04066 family peptide maturation system protein n=1 Tax=Paenibacillus albidus TaxID=2041023 RepID=A0A917FQ97_9BACL|nr:TIGR04066 family peptide maturation system protein [Paenibacillus albidus]GGF94574.1 hypothetical protein GCM10010912_44410 [Paenibacillus albidus]